MGSTLHKSCICNILRIIGFFFSQKNKLAFKLAFMMSHYQSFTKINMETVRNNYYSPGFSDIRASLVNF